MTMPLETIAPQLFELAERLAAVSSEDQITISDATQTLVGTIRSLTGSPVDAESVVALLSDQYDQLKAADRPYSLHHAILVRNVAENLGFPKWIGWTNHDLGKALNRQGRPLEAEEAFRRSLAGFGDHFPEHTAVARGDLGSTLFRLGRLTEAEPLLRQALADALETDSVHNQLERRLGLGNTLVFMSRQREALRILEDGLRQARAASKPYHESAFLTAIANAYENLGRYDECIALHRQALAISRRIDDPASEVEDHRNLGNLYLRLGKHDESHRSYEAAEDLARRLDNEALLASLLVTRGSSLLRAGDAGRAIPWLEQAVETTERLGLDYQRLRALGNLASAYRLAGNLDRARDLTEASLEGSRQAGDPRSLVWDLLNLAGICEEQQDESTALIHVREALALASEMDDPMITHSAEWSMARLLGRSDAGFDLVWGHYARAMEALEHPRRHVARDEDRVGLYGGGKHSLYEDAVLWLLDQQKVEDAFEVAERAKSRLLLDAVSERTSGTLSEPEDTEALFARLRSVSAGSLFVSLFVTSEELLLFFLEPEGPGVTCTRLPVTSNDLTAWLERWLVLVSGLEQEPMVWDPAAAHQALGELDGLVVGTVRTRLAEQPDVERLVWIPHRFLHNVPLHAARNAGDGRFLAQEVGVTYLPALQLLRPSSPTPPGHDLSMLVVGEPATAGDDLPEARAEAEAVVGLFDGVYLAGEEATVEAFQAHALEAEAIHLACHGVFVPARPEASHLLLAADTPLSVAEISAVPLPKLDLVVMAACESGRNLPGGVDEALGLTRGWLLAGARCVVSALWSVDDAVTQRFMMTFYESLLGGSSRAAALRNAQGVLLAGDSSERDPGNWAAFVLTETT